MYKQDIEDLLEHSKKEINELWKSEVISKVKVKNILENLRSSLEYCAQYINSNLLNRQTKVYFPYGKTEGQFRKSINRNFPSLKKLIPDIYALIESLQIHQSNNNWLIIMCEATNTAKHNRALDVEKIYSETRLMKEISIPGAIHLSNVGGTISVTNCSVNGQRVDDFEIQEGYFTKYTKHSISPTFEFEIVENKKIILNDYQCDLIELFEKSVTEIEKFKEKLFEINCG